ncbi:hypothetical protein HYH02_015272 [Chlamydomonas schloesseri]|uniref:Uncharacterized protein n=1 Tax=Chlamydomonas schloesseri TaxID=2026947 RepID=A0A835VSH7_9CHLO|nr:hypothetical protein HYH02_015272 [Chlamydomonas schloesseri]|eukprot:KAG2423869.1 hypothetical protein HYH02_015272 [Chlamydomonas schloesseri]
METGPDDGSIGSAHDSGSGSMGGFGDGGVFDGGPLQGRERLEPAHWYIDFGLENVIREQLFRDERFLKERGNHRMNNPATGESPYQGEAYAELLQKTGGKAGRWESSLVELMFDSVQPFRKASHSSTILSVRYMDVDPRNRGKAWASAVVAVIPGPSIPKAMRAYLLRTVAALQRLAEDGMEVTQPRTIGTQHDPAFKYKHHVYLIGRAVRVGDARLHLTHADQVERGQVADALVLRAHGLEPGRGAADRRDAAAALSAYPVKASNPFTALSYVDLQDMFRVPVVHALLYGVVRAFVLCMLDGTAPEALAFTRDDKRLIQSRASRVVVPSDFGRPYLDLVDYQATFLASASAAHRRLCEFAKLAEENTFPDKTFSVNLHICCCRLLRQEQRVGAAAGDLEFAVERVMQYYKRVASGVAYKPEQHFANEVLLTGAMAEVRAQHSLLSLEDVAGRRQADFSDVQRLGRA